MNQKTSGDDLKVNDGVVVSLDYTLSLEDGDIVDSTSDSEPLEFLQGYGAIISGLEEALYGMSVGDEKHVIVEPDGAYGDEDPDEFQLAPRDMFPADLPLSEGMLLELHDSDSDETVEATVAEIQAEGILLNLNHPLAGETLNFHVKIAGLRAATRDELAHGHVHEDGHNH